MTVGRAPAARLVAALLLIASLVFLTSCGAFGGDQNTFSPAGDVAKRHRVPSCVALQQVGQTFEPRTSLADQDQLVSGQETAFFHLHKSAYQPF